MASGLRHFRALMKKNFINWYRRPFCSLFEIICPILAMFIMVVMRNQIHSSSTPYNLILDKLKAPAFPGLTFSTSRKNPTGSWATGALQWRKVNKDLTPFFQYDDYPWDHHYEKHSEYLVEEDFRSPLYMLPEDCLITKSFQLPPVESPVIAIVGEWNQATYMMQNYLETLFEFQQGPIGGRVIGELLKHAYGGATYPEWQFMNFTSKEELFEYTSAENYTYPDGNLGVCYGFSIQQDEDEEWNLELFFDDQETLGGTSSVGIPTTKGPAYDPLQTAPDPLSYLKWFRRGFTTLHNLAANVVLKIETDDAAASITMLTDAMDSVNNVKDGSFQGVMLKILPFLFVLIFVPPVYNMVSLIVKEKESRVRESMRIMGMSSISYWLSWYVYYTLISTLFVHLAWAVLCINVLQYSDKVYILAFLLMYAQSVFGFIVFVSSLLEKSKFAGIIGTLLYFGFALFGIPVQKPDVEMHYKVAFSIFPQVALQQITFVFGNLEGAQIGLQQDNLDEQIHNYTYIAGIKMLVISFFLYLILGLYLDAVLPRSYGERQSICCCFTRWFRYCRGGRVEFEDDADSFEHKYLDSSNCEQVPLQIQRLEQEDRCLKIQDLTKRYSNGFQAVNGLNLKMYEGQIFALLGQNGAGKSTTLSMLQGLTSTTTGKASIFGTDLFNNMEKARESMGVCPQYDILFDLLTPEEHLDIFYDFKGGDPRCKNAEIAKLINDVGVSKDQHKLAKNLSGGNRRKVSVAIALCGQSRLIMLDEPTAGMDIGARRALWDMLKTYRSNKIIILTTHYMDEADVLGDRIAIMAQGQLLCLGSSLFLKNKYGEGYALTFVKKNSDLNTNGLERFLMSIFGKARKISEIGQEVTYRIPQEQAPLFKSFFEEFDLRMRDYNIASYGISLATLEDVFLKVNDTDNSKQKRLLQIEEQFKQDRKSRTGMEDQQEEEESENSRSFCLSLKAMLAKRFHIYKRDKCGLLCELIIPIILVIGGLLFLQVGWTTDHPTFALDTAAYPSQQTLMVNSQNVVVESKDMFTPEMVMANLPDQDYWNIMYNDVEDITYRDYSKALNTTHYEGSETEEQQHMFGSYQFYKLDNNSHSYQFNMWVDTTSSRVVPYFSQYMYHAILQTVNPSIKFNTKVAPFPTFYVFTTRAQSTQAINFTSIYMIALAMIPCVAISLIIKEREQQLKHMQTISGASLWAYWISNYISDLIQMLIPMAIFIGLNKAFELQYEGVWALLLLYPFSIIPFTYLTSYIFKRDSTAQIMTVFIHFFAGAIMPNVIYYFDNIPYTANLGDSMRWWFVWLPSFCVGQGIVWSSTYKELNLARTALHKLGFNVSLINTNVFAWVNLSGNYAIMLGSAVFYTLLLILVEAGAFKCLTKISFCKAARPDDREQDDDVVRESNRILSQSGGKTAKDENEALLDLEDSMSSQDNIIVKNLKKAYNSLFSRPVLAVADLSFGVKKGECFALLGVNGAGKSTTFKSITNEVVPSSGQITINGHNALTTSGFGEARKSIGYCPQNNIIFPTMTIEEHLWLFVQIKGIPADQRRQVVEDTIMKYSLTDHRRKIAKTLSGGNMRKLSVAIALLGRPSIILLDEPSSGMDPEARRFMWSAVQKTQVHDKHAAVLLTTHSMEEAEALCSQMAIMGRGGFFHCFGSSQHIKNKFGTGFEIQFKIKAMSMEQMGEIQSSLGLEQEADLIDLFAVTNRLKSAKSQYKMILDQIDTEGLGVSLVDYANAHNGQVYLKDLIHLVYALSNGFRVIQQIASLFERVDIVEQVGEYFKIIIPRESKTIGYVFGFIESLKQQININEYSVSQTSLEQIFQNFAQQSYGVKPVHSFRVDGSNHLQQFSGQSSFHRNSGTNTPNMKVQDDSAMSSMLMRNSQNSSQLISPSRSQIE